MNSPNKDWRTELATWLSSHSKQMPPDLQQLREAFVQRFPRAQLPNLTLEDYAIGKPDSFCYWIEFKTSRLGSVAGGSSGKWGIWWSKGEQQWKWNKAFQCSDPKDALIRLRAGLVALTEAAASDQFDQLDRIGSSQLGSNRNSLRVKPLYLYFPEKFLPVSNPYHLTHFLSCFGQPASGGLHAKNRQLLNFLNSQPEFAGMDTLQMMMFLYATFPPGERSIKPVAEPEDADSIQFSEEVVQLATLAEKTRNLILYGPPGTGKTYTVNKFANFFLGEQLNIPLTPEQRQRGILQPLRWYDVIALAMHLQHPKKYFKVAELADHRLIKTYWPQAKTQELSKQIWAALQIHTHPDVEIGKYKPRQPPYLFEKNQQSEWFLTESGEEYVQIDLADALEDLQQPDAKQPAISDYLRFVTFHQSFAYEEFVEGLKPVLEEGQIRYQVVDGIFKAICHQAENDPDHRY